MIINNIIYYEIQEMKKIQRSDYMEFNKWFEKLKKFADEKGHKWLISNDPEAHRESYENGLSIEDEYWYKVNSMGI